MIDGYNIDENMSKEIVLLLAAVTTLLLSVVWLCYICLFTSDLKRYEPIQIMKFNETEEIHKSRDSRLISAHKRLLPSAGIPGSENLQDPVFSSTHRVVPEVDTTRHCTHRQHARGIDVSHDGLVVTHSGMYFVYSGVRFQANSGRYSADFTYQTWFHYVQKERTSEPMNSGVLLRTVHTVCSNCTRSVETSFTGGVFDLKKRDKVFVTLSGQGIVDFDSSSTFLGLFKLAQ